MLLDKRLNKNIKVLTNGDEYINKALASGKSVKQYFFDEEAAKENAAIKFMDTKVFEDSNIFRDGVDGFYATNAFEVLDLTPNMPLSSFFHQILMPKRFGGGLAEGVGAFRIGLALAKGRLAGGSTNEVPLVDTDSEKLQVPTYIIQLGILLKEINWLKSKQINFDELGLKTDALQLSYQRELEYFAFVGNLGLPGITSAGSTGFLPGLLNAPANSILGIRKLEEDAVNGKHRWEEFDVADWTELFVGTFTKMLLAVRYDRRFIPNMVAIPPSLWESLSKPAVVGQVGQSDGAGVAVSILEYIQAQIKRRLQADVVFVELPYIDIEENAKHTTAQIWVGGDKDKGRIVFMRFDEKALRQHITMPLTGGIFAWSPTEAAYRQTFTSVVSVPMFLYPQTVYYVDNGETEVVSPTNVFKLTLPATPITKGDIAHNLVDPDEIPWGTLVKLTLIPDSDKELDTFTVNGVSQVDNVANDNTYVFRIYADTVLTLAFKDQA